MGLITLERPSTDTGRRRGPGARLLIAMVIAIVSIIGYFSHSSYNPITEEKQHIGITTDQEIALGLQSAPEMAQQFGGVSRDSQKQALVKSIGEEIVSKSAASRTPYKYDFHVLADSKTVNAFALPGGQIFVTEGLLDQVNTKGELAGTLAHEVAHVVARHSAEHLAKQQLTQGLTGAAVLATYDPQDPGSRNSAQIAMLVGSLVNMKFSRSDELESDKLAVRFASEAGYDPRSMTSLMQVLSKASRSRGNDFFSTHPNPDSRIQRIGEAIRVQFPQGVPEGLIK